MRVGRFDKRKTGEDAESLRLKEVRWFWIDKVGLDFLILTPGCEVRCEVDECTAESVKNRSKLCGFSKTRARLWWPDGGARSAWLIG